MTCRLFIYFKKNSFDSKTSFSTRFCTQNTYKIMTNLSMRLKNLKNRLKNRAQPPKIKNQLELRSVFSRTFKAQKPLI